MELPAGHDLNADQIAYWNGPGGQHWADRQQAQDVVLGPVSEVLIDRARVRAGERIVDVLTGVPSIVFGLFIYIVLIVGTGSSGENLVAVEIALELASDGDGGTAASWRAELALRGVLSSLLQRAAGGLLREQVESVLAAGVALSEGERGPDG